MASLNPISASGTSKYTIPKVSVVLLNLNAYEDTRECLASLQSVRYPNLEVILVDNGSTDDSLCRLQNDFPHVITHRSEDNLGFAAGNNIGIERALSNDADYVLLLNNDTVVESNFLTELVRIGEEDERIGVLGPKILYFSEPNRIWYAGGNSAYWRGKCRHIGLDEPDSAERFAEPKDTAWVTGCALMVKSRVFREIGLLDERLFIYWEDTDLCSRVLRRGYRCVFVPTGRIWHKVSRTCGTQSPFTLYLGTRNQLVWVAKRVPMPYRIGALPYVLARKIMKAMYVSTTSRESAMAVWEGVWAFLRGKYGPPRAKWMPGRAEPPVSAR